MGALITVPPEDFAASMRDYWTKTLKNTSSAALEELWLIMARTFGEAITRGAEDHKWRVLQPPTGSGKTQGTCLYAAMLVETNNQIAPLMGLDHVGVLIVTRTIVQADEIADTIRAILVDRGMASDDAYRAVAVKHSDNKTSLHEMRNAPVLVICHSAYINALSGIQQERYGRWEDYTNWSIGFPRRLTIIDEMLSGLIEEHSVTASDIGNILVATKPHLVQRFPNQVAALKELRRILFRIEEWVQGEKKREPVRPATWISPLSAIPSGCKMGEFSEALLAEPLDLHVDGKEDQDRLATLRKRFRKALLGAERVFEWCYYAHTNNQAALHHAFMLSPTDMPGPVVLDATARQHPLWGLLKDRVIIPEIPRGVRNYDNVTLFVSRARGLGKHSMKKIEKSSVRVPRAIRDVSSRLPQDSKTLVVVHKATKHHGNTEGTELEGRFECTHWGSLDGKNDWQDFDSVVLVGLSYPHEVWASNLVFAVLGKPDKTLLKEDVLDGIRNVQRDMTRRHLAASVLQAINRVRCRRVIDECGRCPPTSVFLALPPGQEGGDILEYVREEMPGLKVERWDVDLDGPDRRLNPSSCHPRVMEFMRNREAGRTALNCVAKELGLPHSAKRELQKTLRDDDHPLTRGLRDMEVIYQGGGRGRGKEAFLVKLAAPPHH